MAADFDDEVDLCATSRLHQVFCVEAVLSCVASRQQLVRGFLRVGSFILSCGEATCLWVFCGEAVLSPVAWRQH